MNNVVILDENGLTFEDVIAIVINNYQLKLSDKTKSKVQLARKAIEKAVKSGQKIYGITTGFGALRDIIIPENDAIKLQTNLIRSHSVGVGKPIEDVFVKSMMVLRVAALARGHSGCRLKTLENLVDMINKNALPIIPSKGSVGASGDLAPLSHMALAMIGEGKKNLKFKDKIYDAKEGLTKAGITITELSYKEGLALNNGAQFSCGIACLALKDAINLLENAELAAALSMEALFAARQQFDERIHKVRNHQGQMETAKRIRELTKGSKFVKILNEYYPCPNEKCGFYYDPEIGLPSKGVKENTNFEKLPANWSCPVCGTKKELFEKHMPKIQDDYSIRCTPQVLGPARETISHCKKLIEEEINAVTDNPLIFIKNEDPLEFDIYSGGNFHGEPIAIAMDHLAIAIAEVGSISERRSAKLVDQKRNDGLSAFLVHSQAVGLNSGYMMPQYTAAALVSENKLLAHPASIDSIPTSADAEDHVSMSPIAARKMVEIIENSVYIIAIEMMLAIQAIDLRCELQQLTPKEALGNKTYKSYAYLRKLVPMLNNDRIIYPDIEKIAESIRDNSLLQKLS